MYRLQGHGLLTANSKFKMTRSDIYFVLYQPVGQECGLSEELETLSRSNNTAQLAEPLKLQRALLLAAGYTHNRRQRPGFPDGFQFYREVYGPGDMCPNMSTEEYVERTPLLHPLETPHPQQISNLFQLFTGKYKLKNIYEQLPSGIYYLNMCRGKSRLMVQGISDGVKEAGRLAAARTYLNDQELFQRLNDPYANLRRPASYNVQTGP